MVGSGDRAETEQLIEDARRMLDNTRTFLDRIHDGEEASRRYIEDLKASLENEVNRLERKRYDQEGSQRGSEDKDQRA